MSQNQPSLQSLYLIILLILCLCGCEGHSANPEGAQRKFKILDVADNKIVIEPVVGNSKRVSLFIGDKKWGSYGEHKRGNIVTNQRESSTTKNAKILRVTLEASDQIKLEGGASGHGFVYTINQMRGGPEAHSTASMIQYISIDKDGLIPFGQVKVRNAATVEQTSDSVTLAEIETPEGSLVPISVRFE